MTRETATNTQESTPASTAGVILTRIVVPLWLLSGAVLKLIDGSPSNLPTVVVKWLGGTVDLVYVLQLSAAVELVVVGIAWFLPQLARPVTLVALGAFVPVLVGDLLLGASSCGCFGAVHVHPAVTTLMDVGFFLGVLLLGRRARSLRMTPSLPVGRTVLAGLWVVAAFVVSFGLGAIGQPGADAAVEGAAEGVPELPAEHYYVPDYASWLGQRWSDLAIAAWVKDAPDNLADGEQYVIFYRLDCELCHELLDLFFSEDLGWPTTIVAVPERSGFPTAGVLSMPCTACRRAELPADVDWFMATPVMVRLSDGVVECAAEVDSADPECLKW